MNKIMTIITSLVLFFSLNSYSNSTGFETLYGPQKIHSLQAKNSPYIANFSGSVSTGKIIVHNGIQGLPDLEDCNVLSGFQKLKCKVANLVIETAQKVSRVSQGDIYINSIQVVDKTRLNKNTKSFELPVALQLQNSMSVKLKGSIFSFVIIEVLRTGDTPVDLPPVAVLNASPLEGLLPLEVTFDGSASSDAEGIIASFSWDFDDGSTSASAIATHIYNTPGSYTATLTVTDSIGQTATASTVIEVLADTIAPIISVSSPTEGQIFLTGSQVNIVGSSNEPLSSASVNGQALTLSQDGLSFEGQYSPNQLGSQSLEIIATDLNANSATLTRGIYIDSIPQAVLIADPISGVAPLEVQFNALSSTDIEAPISSYFIDFNDSQSSNIPLVSHVYNQAGSYTATLTVTDSLGQTHSVSQIIEVLNDTTAPVLTINSPTEGQEITNSLIVSVSGSSNEVLQSASVNGQALTLLQDGLSFSGNYTHAAYGPASLTVSALDLAGNPASETLNVNFVEDTNVAPQAVLNLSATTGVGSKFIFIDARSSLDPDGSIASYEISFGDSSPNSSLSHIGHLYGPGNYTVTLTVTDNLGKTAQVTQNLTLTPQQIPVDPATIAPPLPKDKSLDLLSSTSFLYEGSNPIQTGLNPAAIDKVQAAVIRGRILDENKSPLPGVKVTVLNHPEYGQTLTRADGEYDLVINGGAYFTLQFEKGGYLPAQRARGTKSQNYNVIKDTILIGLDEKLTTIQPNQNATQVAVGTTETDIGGPRTARLMFPKNTTATMVLPNGSERALQSLNVRMTEYTVGEDGPDKMPAELPRSSAYTYAVELSVDEAIAAGAREVKFNKPVSFYVDNFLNFPVGGAVPVGYYDRLKGHWIPAKNGRVIQVDSISNEQANLIIASGGGVANSLELSELGIDEDERREIALQFSPGATFWRSTAEHFTPYDLNHAVQSDENTVAPSEDQGDNDNQNQCTNKKVPGSIINLQSQILGEKFEIAGTPFSLFYWSDRTPGYGGNRIVIPLVGNEVPDVVPSTIKVEIEVMGRLFEAEYAFTTDLEHEFIWDGLDQFGRAIAGPVQITVTTSYGYVDEYAIYAPTTRALFGTTSHVVVGTFPSDRLPLSYSRSTRVWTLGSIDARSFGLGGWTLDINHSYFPSSQRLMLGSGSDRDVEDSSLVAKFFAGTGNPGFSGDSGLAIDADLNNPAGLSVGPDGSVYIVDEANLRIRKVDPNGLITTVAGNGSDGSAGDGNLATNASLDFPLDIEVGLAGDIFITESDGNRIRRIRPDGIIEAFAGTGAVGYSGDGGLAVNAELNGVVGLVVDKDGSVFFSEQNNHVIRRVDVNGNIETIAGTGVSGYSGEGGHSSLAQLNEPLGMAMDKDKNIYFVDSLNHRVRKIQQDGTILSVAGTGTAGYSGDGGPATEAEINNPIDVGVLPSGELIISDNENASIRKVQLSGRIVTIAGTNLTDVVSSGSPATLTNIGYPRGIAIDQFSNIYFSNESNRVWKLEQLMPRYGGASFSFAQNNQVLLFDDAGLHLETRSIQNGKLIYEFSYDSDNRLSSVSDASGRVTSFERNGDGSIRSIISPDGLETLLSENPDGYLEQLTDPEGGSTSATYGVSGLMATYSNKKGGQSTFGYNSEGRLISDAGPNGGEINLAYNFSDEGMRELFFTSPEGISKSYSVMAGSAEKSTVNKDDDGMGRITLSTHGKNGSNKIEHPSGLVIETYQAADPVYGMSSPYLAYRKIDQGGLIESVTESTLIVEKNSVTNVPEKRTTVSNVNGELYIQSHDLLTNSIDNISPETRISNSTLDGLNRISSISLGTLEGVLFGYNTDGRVENMTQGTRSTTYSYDSSGYLSSVTNSLGQTTEFENDLMGRTTKQTLADGREIRMEYDDSGNMTSITPPGKPRHDFVYDLINLMTEYLPPTFGGGPTNTIYTYNRDKQLVRADRPDGRSVSYEYNPAGQLMRVTPSDSAETNFFYFAASGQLNFIRRGDVTNLYGFTGKLMTTEYVTADFTTQIDFGYNSDFNISSYSIDGNAINLNYDKDQLLVGDDFLSISRNENGMITGSSLNGNSDSYTYNQFGETETYTSSHFNVTYTRDDLGRITNESGSTNGALFNVTYDYDQSGRLVYVNNNGSIQNYDYDDNSNRVGGTYDNQDRLLTFGDLSYTYTANGELLTKTDNSTGEVTTYTYDVFGNLEQVAKGGAVVSYIIDPRNRRVGKKINGTLDKVFVYKDQLNPIAQYDGAGNLQFFFLYGSKPNVPDYMLDTSGTLYRIISNHLGSVKLVVNTSNNQVMQQIDYDVWGNITNDTNPGFQPFGFAGGIYDEHTGLTRFGARDYDPIAARWTSKDPIRFDGGVNLYGYSLQDPVNMFDLDGENPFLISAGIGALVGAGIDLGIQLLQTGGDVSCVDWSQVGQSAIAGALLSGLTPTGFLLGRGGQRAAQEGFSFTRGLLNRGGSRFGWSWNGSNNVLSRRVGNVHRDIPGIRVSGGGRPIRDGAFSGVPAGAVGGGQCGCN